MNWYKGKLNNAKNQNLNNEISLEFLSDIMTQNLIGIVIES